MKSLWKISAMVTILAVVSGCSLSGVTAPPPDKSPEDVVREATTNLSKATSGSYELTLKGDAVGAPGQVPSKVTFDGTIAGLFDSKDPKKPQFTMDLEGKMSLDEGDTQNVKVELRVNQTDLYVNLAQLPDLGESVPKEMVAAFTGKWWQIAIPEGTLDGLLVSGGVVDEANLTPEQKALKDLMEKTNFFTDLAFEGNEKVDGTDCYHYVGGLDKKSMKDFVVEAGKMQGQEIPASDMANLDALLAAVDAPIDLWIDSSNMTMKKFGTVVTIKPEGQGSLNMEFSFVASELNKEITVEVPEGATIFDPAMLFGGAMPASY